MVLNHKLAVYLLLTILIPPLTATADQQTAANTTTPTGHHDARFQWWQQARFGMFIHWGPVSLKGTEIGWSRAREVPQPEYDSLYKNFNPTRFDAKEWVTIAKDTGMKYVVLTAKHHDGFCLWDTETTSYDIMSTPFKRDVVAELAHACKKANLTFCTYYSILDWYHPDYNTGLRGQPGYQLPPGQSPDIDRYIAYMKSHLRELTTKHGPLGVMWFDGEWEKPWTHDHGVDLYQYVRSLQPDILINNRVDKGRQGAAGTTSDPHIYKGDFDTPEQEIGKFQPERPWETCMTLCTQWAWKPNDKIKSLKQCMDILVRTVGGDGNLLLNVGPMPDGRIEPRQVKRLHEIGQWLKQNGHTIYGTRGGPFPPGDWGAATHKGIHIYLHILAWPKDPLCLPALPQKITAARLLNGGSLSFKQTDQATEISVPLQHRDPVDTIVVLQLETPLKTPQSPKVPQQ